LIDVDESPALRRRKKVHLYGMKKGVREGVGPAALSGESPDRRA
jgi:hypothetical protein